MSFTGAVSNQSLASYIQGSVTTTSSAPTGNTAIYFPGITGSYLNLGTSSPVHFNTSTSNLFVETWVNFSQNAYTEYIAGTLYSTTTDDWGFRVDGTFNRFMFYHYNTSGSSTAVTAPSGTPVIQGTWYHVAASFVTTGTNGTIYLYVNGVLQNAGGTSIGGTPRYTAAASAFIGTPSPLPGGWVATNAYMKDIRIIKDGVIPTTSFTPAATPWYYNVIPSYVTGGTNVFGLYGQYLGTRIQITASTPGNGIPVDLAPNPATVPNTNTSTSGPFASEGSLSFTGAPGIQLNGSKFPFNWYTGFTIEAWVNYTSFTNALGSSVVPLAMGVMQIAGNIADWALGPNTTGQLRFYYYFTGQNFQLSSNTMSTGTWTHICAQHDGTSFHMYINGVRCVGPVTITGAVALSSTHSYFSFGQYFNSSVPTFKIADVRLVQGANVYPVTGFTPPAAKLTTSPVGTTILLMQVPLGSSSTMTGASLFSQLSATASSNLIGAFSTRSINGPSVKTAQVIQYTLLTVPPIGLTQNTFTATGTYNGVTNGQYVALCSSYNSTSDAYRCFDGNNATRGLTAGTAYTVGTGAYIGSASTVDSTSATYNGSWFQIKIPSAISAVSYRLAVHSSLTLTAPYTWKLFGSTSGTSGSWVVLDTQTNYVFTSQNISFQLSALSAGYTYFRLAANKISPSSSAGDLGPAEITIFGYSSLVSSSQDFWADRLGNLLTAPVTGTPLTTWLGSSTGYVATFYSQYGSSTATQSTASNQLQIISGLPQFSSADASSYYPFSGINLGSIDGSYSKAFWVYATSNASQYDNFLSTSTAVSGQGIHSFGWVFGTGSNIPVIYVGQNNYTQYNISSFALNTWTHMAMTYSNPTQTLVVYKNGSQVYSNTSWTSSFNAGDGALATGFQMGRGYGNPCDAQAYDVLIFNSALSSTDISTIYNYRLY